MKTVTVQNLNRKLYADSFPEIFFNTMRMNVDDQVLIKCKNQTLGKALIVDREEFFLSDLPNVLAILSLGMARPEAIKHIKKNYNSLKRDWTKDKITVFTFWWENKYFNRKIEMRTPAAKQQTISKS